jgi:hypothetical protein
MWLRIRFLILAGIALALAPIAAARAQSADPCVAASAEASEEVVITGVTLIWDSALICPDPAARGAYEVVFAVANSAASGEAVTLTDFRLSHTTPRMRGPGNTTSATFAIAPETAALAPGERAQFTVRGDYVAAADDDGNGVKITMHFRFSGQGASSATQFHLPVNVHLQPLATDDDDDGPGGAGGPNPGAGPPAWVCMRGGGPPWLCT